MEEKEPENEACGDREVLERIEVELSAEMDVPVSRKRAYANARFFAECALRGIPPTEADSGIHDAQRSYNKWWKESVFSSQEESPQSLLPPSKMAKLENVKASVDRVRSLKRELITILKKTGGDTTDERAQAVILGLKSIFESRNLDLRWKAGEIAAMDSTWLCLSRPTFTECRGRNEQGEYIYTLGRISFDMFRPRDLVCSIQGVFITGGNHERTPILPMQLKFESGSPLIRTYNTVVALTIVPDDCDNPSSLKEAHGPPKDEPVPVPTETLEAAPDTSKSEDEVNDTKKSPAKTSVQRPIKALLTNNGCYMPDPGSLEVEDEKEHLEEWTKIFKDQSSPTENTAEVSRTLASRILFGARPSDTMSDDGTLTYSLLHPIGGHGSVFCDILFADDDIRILKGHRGSTFVFRKVR